MDKLHQDLKRLEESLWIEETRFDNDYMDKVLEDAFFEFGRSGKTYSRTECMSHSYETIGAKIRVMPEFCV